MIGVGRSAGVGANEGAVVVVFLAAGAAEGAGVAATAAKYKHISANFILSVKNASNRYFGGVRQ